VGSSQTRDVGSAPTLAARLRQARRRRFVGREGELELFRAGLEGAGAPWSVLFVYGPGGVGKTALLGAFAEAAEAAGVPAWRVDLRGVELSPTGFAVAVAGAMGVTDGAAAVARLGSGGRRVLLLDTYERAGSLDRWVREGFLPGLGADTLVVVAGRDAPSPGWLEDAGWRELLRVVSLRNLSPGDARAFLRGAGVADGLHERVLELTHGHPLALSLLVDVVAQRGDEARVPALDLGRAPDVLGLLLERFVAGVPGERHRLALEVCAHSRVTTEDLLRTALRGELGGEDAGALFGWLRGLSFVETGDDGLFPHDLARDVLDAELRWRDRARYADIHRRVRRHVVTRIRESTGREQQRAAADLQFLHRGNAGIRRFYDWASLGRGYVDGLRAGDAEAVVAMIERHETPEAASLARFWLERQPRSFLLFRRPGEDEPFGFATMLALHEASAAERAADPGAAAMWAYAVEHGAPRPGEEVFAFRTYMDAEAYQSPSASFNLAAVLSVQHYASRPRLAWDFIGGWADPDAVAPYMAHIDYARVPEADFEVGGRRYGVFAHDWRRTGLEAWFELMEARELADEPAGGAPPPLPPAGLALSQAEFTAAVRAALRDLRRPEALAANPLAVARVVRDRGAGEPVAEVLEALLREAVASLQCDPRDEKLHRALDRAYLRPAPSHEAAAELLGVPLSSFRRHLARGTERVAAWLWERELYGSGR
jgi:AAA ATPase domain